MDAKEPSEIIDFGLLGVRQFAVRFYPADSDAWEHLQKQPNKAGYIKALIRADIEKSAE